MLSHSVRCLVGFGARHRYRGFATDGPASGAFSLPRSLSRERARPGVVIQELFARGRDGPRAACQLLQSKTIREHNCGRTGLRATSPSVARKRSLLSRYLSLSGSAGVTSHTARASADGGECLSTSRSQPRGHGSGALLIETAVRSRLSAFHDDRSPGKLRPNPIDSDTSCRRLVMSHWTELSQGHRSIARAPFGTRLPRRDDFAFAGRSPPCRLAF